MTAAPGLSYSNDILGNRLSRVYSSNNASDYTWDALDRMTGISSTLTAGGSTYTYRADGMRTQKAVTNNAFPPVTTNDMYCHDGQMPFEDEQISGSNVTAVRSILGARGLEAEQTCTGTISGTTRTLSAPAFTYPVYDAHGNRIATLQRGATAGTYTVGSIRYFGTWGEVRVGATTGGSNGRYCANLGHLQDDESGLVYMRARYYEPGSGRFVSEDLVRSGKNWFVYALDYPIHFRDQTGAEAELDWATFYEGLLGACIGVGVFFGMKVGDAIFDSCFKSAMAEGGAGCTKDIFDVVMEVRESLMDEAAQVGIGELVGFLMLKGLDSVSGASGLASAFGCGLVVGVLIAFNNDELIGMCADIMNGNG